ncbi:uncharacterized protein LOC134529068 [Bacillus rossius redtenbacheri]|uniref:uncharacterized protein LOC134529068 n=1 Tax=Bacillus rossius redtenbacheri TaxID=93214 RepID=UPI002FDE1507
MSAIHSLIVCCALVVAFVSAAPERVFDGSVLTKCAETFQMPVQTYDYLHSIESLPENPDERTMCFYDCLLSSKGTMKDGVFQEDFAKENFARTINEKLGSVDQGVLDKVLSCGKKTAEGKCATSYAVFKCMHGVLQPVFKGLAH